MSNVKYKGAVAAGIIAGSAVGVVTGLLIAPKSGKEMREDIADKTKEGLETAKHKVSDVVGKKDDPLTAARKAAHEAIDKIGS